jgi:AhpD family alkylhydroperoxidase
MTGKRSRKPSTRPKKDQASEVGECLGSIEALYGRVPLVPEILSQRPDIFLPYFQFSNAVLLHPKHLDRKTLELAAVAAGSALASEHCLSVHLDQARAAGASQDEILEAIMVGAFMTMTRSQSVALRSFKAMEPKEQG